MHIIHSSQHLIQITDGIKCFCHANNPGDTVYVTVSSFTFDSGFFLAPIACSPSACLCANVSMPIMTDLFLSLNLPFTGRQPANE